ncbi:MAG: CARDB domain-containing protein [Candidatus Norongarragalinales archaeon]
MNLFSFLVAFVLLVSASLVFSSDGETGEAGVTPVRLPDYVVWPFRADKFGDGVRVQAVTLNHGQGDAKPHESSFTRIIANSNATDFPVTPLRRGQPSSLHVVDFKCKKGNNVFITAIADFYGSVEESDETNNAVSTRVVC